MLLSTLALVCVPVPEVEAVTLTLDIITPHWEGITTEYERAFNDYYFAMTGDNVTINWIDVGGTSDIVAYVNAAFAANSETTANIDIWWGGGVDPFLAQKALDHLVSYQVNSTILANVATNISGIPVYDTMNHTWYGTALSGFGIIYNKEVLSLEGLPVPSTWEDLADPLLEGWVGSADPRHSGSTHMAYEIIMQAYGWEEGFEIATMLGANVKTWPTSSSAVPKSVSAGDVAYGLAIDFYAWSEISKHGADKLGYVLPEALTVINPDSIAILKGAPHLNLSKAFVDFTLSEAGQKLWMLPKGHAEGPVDFTLGRMCVWPSLYTELAADTVVPTNPFEVTSQLDYNATLGSLRYSLLNDLIGSMIIDSQADLVAVWGEISGINTTLTEAGVTSTYIDNAVSKMGELPITEAEGSALAEEWDNATLRNEKITEWHTFALSKYTNASSLAKLAATELADYFNNLLAQLEAEKTNNLYMGLGGGAIIGIVIGAIVVYFMGRQKEIAEVKR
jgi:ABC-type Fe3+ transport system substrate-binding protein